VFWAFERAFHSNLFLSPFDFAQGDKKRISISIPNAKPSKCQNTNKTISLIPAYLYKLSPNIGEDAPIIETPNQRSINPVETIPAKRLRPVVYKWKTGLHAAINTAFDLQRWM